jgi:hypothetical protein
MKTVNSMQHLLRLGLVLATGWMTVSCGAGSGQTAGIDRGGVTSGPVTAYGSIWVNGERYVTSNAMITVNGDTVDESELAIGQVVLLTSTRVDTTLTADTVSYESNLVGPVQSVDIVAGELIALGQTVRVTATTSFSADITPADLTGLTPGDTVEVSGLVDAAGAISATRIELESASAPLRLTGEITASSADRFNIGAQQVDYSLAPFMGFPGGVFNVGDRVRVTGSGLGGGGEILATEVIYRGSGPTTEEGDEGDIEGLITNFLSPASFTLAGFAVVANAQTQYSGGTASDLGNSIRIEAEGDFDASGTLVADEIEFRQEGDAGIEATVDAVDTAANTVTVFGVEVLVTSLTRIEDKRDEMRPFHLADLNSGDFLKIAGSWDGSQLIATQLERIEGEDKFKLDGPLTASTSPSFTLLGKDVQTDAMATEFATADMPASSSEFFAAVAICLPAPEGCEAEAAWDASGPLLIADEVELD